MAVIRLNVDGCPRAFVYELALNRQNDGCDIRRDERSIRIVSLQMQNENRVFRTTREEVVTNDQPSEAKTEVLDMQHRRARCIRRARARATPFWSDWKWMRHWTRLRSVIAMM